MSCICLYFLAYSVTHKRVKAAWSLRYVKCKCDNATE